jgi:hypothetical protein
MSAILRSLTLLATGAYPETAAFHRLLIALLVVALSTNGSVADHSAETQRLLKAHVEFLCSDALEGRGLGSKGLDRAATYLAEQFRQYGLKTDSYKGMPFQEFDGAMRVELGPRNQLTFFGPGSASAKPDSIKLTFGFDYVPLAIGGSGKLSAPLVFAGYGITNREKDYDDYEGLNIAGKAVIIFSGAAPEKIRTRQDNAWLAQKRGACAVFFVHSNGEVERLTKTYVELRRKAAAQLAEECNRFGAINNPSLVEVKSYLQRVDVFLAMTSQFQGYLYDLHDVRLAFARQVSEENPGYPILSLRRSVADRLLTSVGKPNLSTLEKKIADSLKPQSLALPSWSLEGEVEVQRTPIKAKNVIAVLEGAGALADETIVVGAHYDALGYRDLHILEAGLECECPVIASRTRYDPWMALPRVIHPGANDNAAGAAVILEVAREMAECRLSPRRRLVFIAFAVEELGTIGSKAYVRQPLFPLDKTVAMINLDMVGRLQVDKMNVFGAALPGPYSELLDQAGSRHRLQFNKLPVKPWSEDQAPFHRHQVPTLYFTTGVDDKIHSPEDRLDRLNITGMQRISGMLREFIIGLATNPDRPKYRGIKRD